MDDDPADEDSYRQVIILFLKTKVYLKPFFYPRP